MVPEALRRRVAVRKEHGREDEEKGRADDERGRAFVPLNKIRIADANTDVLPNVSMTGGSTTSEASCASVMVCCEQLVARLLPVRIELEKAAAEPGAPAPTWETICATAKKKGISLCSQAMLRKPTADDSAVSEACPDLGTGYHNFGAAVSEVELDVLTGEINVLRTDICYDCGESLNPAIDLGQCEGGFVQGLGE